MNREAGFPNYNAVDLAKLVLALIILCAHFAATHGPFPAWLDTGLSIYVIAVPFFFACSGFLLFGKVRRLDPAGGKAAVRTYAGRIARIYLAWSGIYFAFVLTGWIQARASSRHGPE